QRFTYLPDDPFSRGERGESMGQLWHVPVQVRITAGGANTIQRLLLTEVEARLPLPAECSSVLINEGGHGFYRVRYDSDLLNRLLALLPGGLAPIERFKLVSDNWAAVMAGLTPVTDYLDLTARFRGERDKNVWSVLTASFAALNRIIDDSER